MNNSFLATHWLVIAAGPAVRQADARQAWQTEQQRTTKAIDVPPVIKRSNVLRTQLLCLVI